jgi:hypothetical protein
LDDVEDIVVGVGNIVVGGVLLRLLVFFDVSLLLKLVPKFDIFGTGCARLETMWSWGFNGGAIGSHRDNCCL